MGHGAGCLRGCVSVFGADQSVLPGSPASCAGQRLPVAPPHMSIRLSREVGGVWESPCLRRLMLWDERIFSLRMTDEPMTGNAAYRL